MMVAPRDSTVHVAFAGDDAGPLPANEHVERHPVISVFLKLLSFLETGVARMVQLLFAPSLPMTATGKILKRELS